jgi:SAM-dependent methyltransferase
MSFQVPAQAYGSFMGRFSEPLADEFVEVARLAPGQRALDVGCGPGALTARLVALLGEGGVSAIDPSEPFVAAAKERFPGADISAGTAESLRFDDDTFDASMAQLVVHFMQDPVAGLREMARVTRPGGVVAAAVWNHATSAGPLSLFWGAVRAVDPQSEGEGDFAGVKEGDLARLFVAAGLDALEESILTVHVPFDSFDQWWEPYTLGVGPAGQYVAGLGESSRDALKEECRRRVPEGAFTVDASSWCVAATVPRT